MSLTKWNPPDAMVAAERSHGLSGGLREELGEAELFLRLLAVRLCGNDQDARDLVQDAFEHALRAGDTTPANPRGYLAVILKNLFIDRCRSLACGPVVVALEGDHEVASPEQEIAPAWARLALSDVRAALEEIDPEFRRVYEMHVFEQRSYEEIAQTLGIQRLTVGTRLTRTRQRLRVILSRQLSAEGGR